MNMSNIAYGVTLALLSLMWLSVSWQSQDFSPRWVWVSQCFAGVASLFVAVTIFNSLSVPTQVPLLLLQFAVCATIFGILVSMTGNTRQPATAVSGHDSTEGTS